MKGGKRFSLGKVLVNSRAPLKRDKNLIFVHNAQTHGKSVGGDTCPFNILLQEEILLKSVK